MERCRGDGEATLAAAQRYAHHLATGVGPTALATTKAQLYADLLHHSPAQSIHDAQRLLAAGDDDRRVPRGRRRAAREAATRLRLTPAHSAVAVDRRSSGPLHSLHGAIANTRFACAVRVRATERFPGLAVAALASLGAGAVHAAATGIHAEHPQLARLFVVVTVLQLGVGLWALVRPTRVAAAARSSPSTPPPSAAGSPPA